jgi:hypothetical protein
MKTVDPAKYELLRSDMQGLAYSSTVPSWERGIRFDWSQCLIHLVAVNDLLHDNTIHLQIFNHFRFHALHAKMSTSSQASSNASSESWSNSPDLK